MSHPNQPPPLPPRSPRPPVTTYNLSPQSPVPSFPPPPPGPPPGTRPVLTPVGPPPPLPPRPAGYEIRQPSNPAISPAQYPSTIYSPSSPSGHVNPNSPLPPPPPLEPPPPYTASAVDLSHSPHQPPVEKPGGQYAAHTFMPSPVPSPSILAQWTNIPPPPPGPPPQLSPYLSPGVPQYTPTPPSPLSPAEAPIHSPASHSFSGYIRDQTNPLGISGTHNNGFQVPGSPSENPYTYQPTSNNLNTSYHVEKPPLEQSASVVSSGTPLKQEDHFNIQPSDGHSQVSSPISPSIQSPSLESSFQYLNVTSAPPVPPKTPLASDTARNQPAKPVTPAPSSFQGYSNPSNQAQTRPKYKAYVPPTPNAQPKPVSHPVPPPQAVTSCIDEPQTFPTDWYWHPEAADFLICSRCYVDNIHGTRYQPNFQTARYTDGKPRVCRFSKPRMKEQLFRQALASGSLQPVVEWMQRRSAIPDCRGMSGVKGGAVSGLKWYAPSDGSIPGLVVCGACYEDVLMVNQFAYRFAICTNPHLADAVWACDIATPFIESEYRERARRDDWAGFVAGAKARLAMPPCSGARKVAWREREWFVPSAGCSGITFCAACFHDRIMHSGEEAKWEQARTGPDTVRCAFSSMVGLQVLLSQAREKENWAIFWDGLAKMAREKPCDENGIVDGVWYTLPSNPPDVMVCAACYVTALEVAGTARFWVRKRDVAPAARMLCCFNTAHPKVWKFLTRWNELYLTLDAKSLEEYASLHASLPSCLRDEDQPGRRWYGWKNCKICPECYFDFARNGPLAALMELNNVLLAENTMCEMYSRRMRALYTECGNANPPNLKHLLETSAQRRQVYFETIPPARMILEQQRIALNQQRMYNSMSSTYTFMGQLDQTNYGTAHAYSMPGVGYGFANGNALQGAIYGQQGADAAASIRAGGQAIRQLTARWSAVE
ncbi:hypothetical protein GGR51DRAFT_200880 [Nemania sp. FL0031]|nr:hypothetical protein GGR51DRAFT_200880 [Nemania sp. FL0031]